MHCIIIQSLVMVETIATASVPDFGCIRSCRTTINDTQSPCNSLTNCCPNESQAGCWQYEKWPESYWCKKKHNFGREYVAGTTFFDGMMVEPGVNRFYGLHLPTGYDPNATLGLPPLVISMHGWGGRISQHEAMTGLSKLADQENFIVVYPQGMGDANTTFGNYYYYYYATFGNWYSWNGVGSNGTESMLGPTCNDNHTQVACYVSCQSKLSSCDTKNPNGPCDWTSCADDVAFIELLLDHLQKSLCFDLSRIYMTGFSNGAMWLFEAARARFAGRIAAFAPVAGSPHYGFMSPPNLDSSDSPMPLMVVHGVWDYDIPANSTSINPSAPYTVSAQSYIGWRYTKTDDVLALWANASGCDQAQKWEPYHPPLVLASQVTNHSLWCIKRCEIVSCTWDGGHEWPGELPSEKAKEQGSPVPMGAQLVWGFLREHRLTNGTSSH
jgi:polyhydroxybutyrate depolymerase